MRATSLKEIKDELKHASQEELIAYCLRLVKFKKENKELLSYLLFDLENDELYITDCKEEINRAFAAINTINTWAAKKQIRKILAQVKKNIRYSQKKEIEIELLLHFCQGVKQLRPAIQQNKIVQNTLDTQLRMVHKAISTLHPDLQHDYREVLEKFK